jgi:hypothetical protein
MERKQVYAKKSEGSYVIKPITRGRPPLGFIRMYIDDDGNLEDVTRSEILVAPSPEKSIVILTMDKAILFEEVKKTIKSMRVEQGSEIVSMFGCDIIGQCPIDYLMRNPVHSRINIMLRTGDIFIWHDEFVPDSPDVILAKAIKFE